MELQVTTSLVVICMLNASTILFTGVMMASSLVALLFASVIALIV